MEAVEIVATMTRDQERKIGGLSIHIIRQNMDSINYERMDNLNVLTLRKKIKNEKLRNWRIEIINNENENNDSRTRRQHSCHSGR